MPNIKYPINKRLNRISDLTHAITQFLNWAEKEKGLSLCESYKPQYAWYVPSHDCKEKLLLEFFGIDLHELENEKRQMQADYSKAA